LTEFQDTALILWFHQDSVKFYSCFILKLNRTSLQYHLDVRMAYLLQLGLLSFLDLQLFYKNQWKITQLFL